MPDNARTIVIKGVNKHYDSHHVLKDIDLEIPAGAFCALLGASGSGKTTLLNILAGFNKADGGAILVDGLDIARVPVSKRNIGMVFQNYALFPNMTVAGNVAFPLEMRKLGKAEIARRVGHVLALVGLDGLAERLPRQLSGGQQQRVALARALVFEPAILLMDEPLGALDKNLRQTIQHELKRLHRQLGVTVVYVTHDQEEALFLSDLLVVMEKGRIAQAGEPKSLYLKPASPFVAQFLGDCNLFRLENGRTVGVRPEHVAVGEAARSMAYRYRTRLTANLFTGATRRILLQLEDDEVLAVIRNNEHAADFEPGAEVLVGFSDAVAIPFEGTAFPG